MLNVLLTVDTEVYPLFSDWRSDQLKRDIQRDIYGETPQGEFGLKYQIETLKKWNLKAVFFVEGLFANGVGLDPLRQMIQEITTSGHEVQLHLHPEWLEWMPEPPVPSNGRWKINQFSLAEQTKLIEIALGNLQQAGATSVSAYRAGDYAANRDTLAALRANGIVYDSSYNPCYANSFPDVPKTEDKTQPFWFSEIWEIPVSYWNTYPLGKRHAQITNSSFGELKGALNYAQKKEWSNFVIVSHSFELLKKRRQRIHHLVPDRYSVSRFEKLCRFLGENRDRFRTCGFSELTNPPTKETTQKPPLSSPIYRTGFRLFQQLVRKVT